VCAWGGAKDERGPPWKSPLGIGGERGSGFQITNEMAKCKDSITVCMLKEADRYQSGRLQMGESRFQKNH